LAAERRISAERAAALDAAEQTYRTERDEATEALVLAATTIQSVAERRRVVASTASPRKRNISLCVALFSFCKRIISSKTHTGLIPPSPARLLVPTKCFAL
jgi:hypothetical protein